jgi:hypothetical protein
MLNRKSFPTKIILWLQKSHFFKCCKNVESDFILSKSYLWLQKFLYAVKMLNWKSFPKKLPFLSRKMSFFKCCKNAESEIISSKNLIFSFLNVQKLIIVSLINGRHQFVCSKGHSHIKQWIHFFLFIKSYFGLTL